MTEKIRTKTFKYGDEKEADWPPMFGTGGAGLYHWDAEAGCLKDGPAPSKIEKCGQAPYVIQDSIDRYYHPAAEVYVDSKSRLRDIDNACGTITTDKKLPPDPTNQNRAKRERREDMSRSLRSAVEQIDSGTAKLSEEQKEMCRRENERVSNLLQFDAFNVAGRKDEPRGKKYRKRK